MTKKLMILLITTAFGDNYCSLDSQTAIIIAKHGVSW